MKSSSQPGVLLITTNWWPLSARLAIAWRQYGCSVSVICPPGHPLRCLSGIQKIYDCSAFDSVIQRAIKETRPDIVVPCDDRATWHLHDLHASKPEFRPLIERSLGSPSAFEITRSRNQLLQLAGELGIRVPETYRVESEDEITEWYAQRGGSAVLKLDGTWGGEGVEIVHSCEDATTAFRSMRKPLSLTTSCKRFLVNRDPLALYAWRKQRPRVITIQEFIQGNPANTMVACWQGQVLAQVSVEVLCAQGKTGAATVVRMVEREEFTRAARLLAERLGMSGFFGLDFMLDQSARAYLIEMNPRCTQLGHLQLAGQDSLAGALYARLATIPRSIPRDPIESSIIAFFPQALEWSPASSYLRRGYHDVPWEEINLVRELLMRPWPERHWLSRLYHRLRPVDRAPEFTFHDVGDLEVSSTIEAAVSRVANTR